MRISIAWVVLAASVSVEPSMLLAQQLPPAVDAFVSSSNALVKATTESVELGRASERLTKIRAELTSKLLTAKATPNIRLSIDLDALICEARVNNVDGAVRRNYLQAVAGQVQKVGTPSKIDNLSTAIQTLFSGENLDVAAGLSSGADLESSKQKLRERCKRDFQTFDSAYYGKDLVVPPEPPSAAAPIPGFASFTPAGALVDLIVSIFTPVIIEGSKIVDEERRRKAVVAFLEDEKNIEKIEKTGTELAKGLSSFTWNKRLRLAGGLNEGAAVMRGTSIELTKNQNCKTLGLARSPVSSGSSVPTDDFALCWRFAWGQIEPAITSFLKDAEQYDQIADIGDTDNALKAFDPLARSLKAIKNDDDASLKKFWSWAIRLIAFGQKVEAAFSDENRSKVQKSIEALVKTF